MTLLQNKHQVFGTKTKRDAKKKRGRGGGRVMGDVDGGGGGGLKQGMICSFSGSCLGA